jgi:hypothetical protein
MYPFSLAAVGFGVDPAVDAIASQAETAYRHAIDGAW